MGLFGFNSKEKKEDLRAEDLPKRGLFAFLDAYFGRFFKFMGINCLMVGANLIYMVLLCWISPINASTLEFLLGGEVAKNLWVHIDLFARIIFALLVVLFWGSGPMTAGVSYIFRCYASREHAWIMSDFKDKMIENAFQGFILMIVDLAVIILAPLAFRFYGAKFAQSGSPIFLVIIGIMIVVLVIYTFMHYFMYQMMVRFECKIKELYKNAYILTLVKFPMLLFITVIALALFFIPIYYLEIYSLMLFCVVLMSLIRFILEFYASRVIEDTIEPEQGKEKRIDHDRKWHR